LCADNVPPGSWCGAKVSPIPVAVEQVTAETNSGMRDVHMQQRVFGHFYQRRTDVPREFHCKNSNINITHLNT